MLPKSGKCLIPPFIGTIDMKTKFYPLYFNESSYRNLV